MLKSYFYSSKINNDCHVFEIYLNIYSFLLIVTILRKFKCIMKNICKILYDCASLFKYISGSFSIYIQSKK